MPSVLINNFIIIFPEFVRYRRSLVLCVLDHSVLVLLDRPTLFTLQLAFRVAHTLYHPKALLIIIFGVC